MEDKKEIKEDKQYMDLALKEAKKAYHKDEVPIGAVVVREGKILGRGYNLREKKQDPTAHAEMTAIRQASAALKSWRLEDCTLYVTLEPCPMCAGAMLQARIKRVVYGTTDPKGGAVDTLYSLLQDSRFNHQVEVKSGVKAEKSRQLLQEFFQNLRKRKDG